MTDSTPLSVAAAQKPAKLVDHTVGAFFMTNDDGLQTPSGRTDKTPAGSAAVSAHHRALRAEIATLRGVVAALRSRRLDTAPRREPRRFAWGAAAVGFAVGVLVTLAAIALLRG